MKPKPKQESERQTTFAKGGSGPANKMFKQQAAGADRPGNTGKDQSAAPGRTRASGGTTKLGHTTAVPAKAGQTGSAVGRGKGR